MNKFIENKAIECLAYIAARTNLTAIKAYKLIWLADRYHLGKYARTITGDQYYALVRGPIPSIIKSLVNHKINSERFSSLFSVSGNRVSITSELNSYQYLSESDKEVLNLVLEAYGDYNEVQLSELSHLSPEWLRFKSLLIGGRRKSFKMEMADFFEDFNDPKGLFARGGAAEVAKKTYYCL